MKQVFIVLLKIFSSAHIACQGNYGPFVLYIVWEILCCAKNIFSTIDIKHNNSYRWNTFLVFRLRLVRCFRIYRLFNISINLSISLRLVISTYIGLLLQLESNRKNQRNHNCFVTLNLPTYIGSYLWPK